jgi:hypothetical protein
LQQLESRSDAITNENASEHPPPNLNKFKKAGSRGPALEPALWFEKMIGKKWDGDGSSYKKAKMQWSGMTGEWRSGSRATCRRKTPTSTCRRSERWSAWMQKRRRGSSRRSVQGCGVKSGRCVAHSRIAVQPHAAAQLNTVNTVSTRATRMLTG